tara:strand:+ start:522 stop:1574 length:1053 start_codon:yes stop_codon:yes gene_type:complete
MKLCILGEGLVSLTLAKALINEGVYVDVISNKKKLNYNKSQTIGISKSNVEFFNKNILNIEKLLWDVNKIEIFSENLDNKKILDFKNKNQRLFSILKNYKLYNLLFSNLIQNKYFKFKKKFVAKNYGLVINCDSSNIITKNFFFNKFDKKYNSYAHTTLIEHKYLDNNHVASQIFTKKGPLAFLPISEKLTSIVYSVKGKKDINLENLIKKYNFKYEIVRVKKSYSFELKFSTLRSYHHGNILAFGDILHKLHPLAGQGFNMTIRDTKELLKMIKYKKSVGLDLDTSICLDFEKKIKHKNYLFSHGIDFIYEFFNFENKIDTNILSKSIYFLNKNKSINKFFTKFADTGI